MGLAPTEGAEMDAIIFVGTWVSAVASEIPTNTDDTVVRGEKIPVTVF